MTHFYSLNDQRPTPLPFRITLPGGFTRTDPSTFTADEIRAAGFTGPYTEPPYDPATQQLDWIDGAYVISALPPPAPSPDWSRFKNVLLTNQDANAALSAALPHAPGAVMAIPAGIMSAAAGDWGDFRAAWLVLRRQDLVPQSILDAVTALAIDCELPADFVRFLGGQTTPPDAEAIGQEWSAPDGTLWRVVQARDAATGQFIADDPATPKRESLQWVPVP